MQREGERGQRPCLHRVVEAGAGGVQREVLEGLDTGLAPALLLLPFHHQHVVRECLPKHQGLAGVRLLMRLLRHFQLQVCSLRKDRGAGYPEIWWQLQTEKLQLPRTSGAKTQREERPVAPEASGTCSIKSLPQPYGGLLGPHCQPPSPLDPGPFWRCPNPAAVPFLKPKSPGPSPLLPQAQ